MQVKPPIFWGKKNPCIKPHKVKGTVVSDKLQRSYV